MDRTTLIYLASQKYELRHAVRWRCKEERWNAETGGGLCRRLYLKNDAYAVPS
jgi:hypothetical protein